MLKLILKVPENLKKFDKYFAASERDQLMFETFALQTVISGPIFILKKELMKIPFFAGVFEKNWCSCYCSR